MNTQLFFRQKKKLHIPTVVNPIVSLAKLWINYTYNVIYGK